MAQRDPPRRIRRVHLVVPTALQTISQPVTNTTGNAPNSTMNVSKPYEEISTLGLVTAGTNTNTRIEGFAVNFATDPPGLVMAPTLLGSTKRSKSSLVHHPEPIVTQGIHPKPYTVLSPKTRVQLRERRPKTDKDRQESDSNLGLEKSDSEQWAPLIRFPQCPASPLADTEDKESQLHINSDESEVEALLNEEGYRNHSPPESNEQNHSQSSQQHHDVQMGSSSNQSMSKNISGEGKEEDVWGGIFDQVPSDNQDVMCEAGNDSTRAHHFSPNEAGDGGSDVQMDSNSDINTETEMTPVLWNDEDFTAGLSQVPPEEGRSIPSKTDIVPPVHDQPGPSRHDPECIIMESSSSSQPRNPASNSKDPLNAILSFLGKATGVLERVEKVLTHATKSNTTISGRRTAVASDFMRMSKPRGSRLRSGARKAPQPREPSVNQLRKAMRAFINKKLGRKGARSPPSYAPPGQDCPDLSISPFALKAEPIQSSFNVLAIRLLVQEYRMRYPTSVPKSDIKDYFTNYLKEVYKRSKKLANPDKRNEAAQIAHRRQRKNKKIIRRMKAAARVPWLKRHVPIISQMGLEAMSSEETIGDGEAFVTHGVPWLSQPAVDLLHGVDDAEEYILRTPHQRRPAPRIPGPPLEHREVKAGLPHNAYKRDFFEQSGLDPIASAKAYDFSLDPELIQDIAKRKAAKVKARS
ncbi:hypothetical protein FS837_000980 [Tulasnella sp. UAMH 9824]|nr:hypothetical protein FS837_000980 [Tulasnella sp. UAMH 9824]